MRYLSHAKRDHCHLRDHQSSWKPLGGGGSPYPVTKLAVLDKRRMWEQNNSSPTTSARCAPCWSYPPPNEPPGRGYEPDRLPCCKFRDVFFSFFFDVFEFAFSAFTKENQSLVTIVSRRLSVKPATTARKNWPQGFMGVILQLEDFGLVWLVSWQVGLVWFGWSIVWLKRISAFLRYPWHLRTCTSKPVFSLSLLHRMGISWNCWIDVLAWATVFSPWFLWSWTQQNEFTSHSFRKHSNRATYATSFAKVFNAYRNCCRCGWFGWLCRRTGCSFQRGRKLMGWDDGHFILRGVWRHRSAAWDSEVVNQNSTIKSMICILFGNRSSPQQRLWYATKPKKKQWQPKRRGCVLEGKLFWKETKNLEKHFHLPSRPLLLKTKGLSSPVPSSRPVGWEAWNLALDQLESLISTNCWGRFAGSSLQQLITLWIIWSGPNRGSQEIPVFHFL